MSCLPLQTHPFPYVFWFISILNAKTMKDSKEKEKRKVFYVDMKQYVCMHTKLGMTYCWCTSFHDGT